MSKCAQWFAVLLAVPMLGSASVQAASFTHQVVIPTEDADWDHVVALPQFDLDSSMGALTHVQIRLLGGLGGTLGVENLDDKFNLVFGDFAGTFEVRDDQNNVILSLALSRTGSVVLDPFDFDLDYGGASGYTFAGLGSTGQVSQGYTEGVDDLSPFIGTGNLNFSVRLTDNSSATAGSGTPAYFSTLNGFGILEITYGASVVPEPDHLISVAVLLSLCMVARHRRKASRRRVLS